ncbi:hypothetical protein F5X96DRAFT_653791 [Biscogniauxia mediterranea]|nr:hypothetical protein F5X96DRAFT_653791 [Biscogniauxia mediterranea]
MASIPNIETQAKIASDAAQSFVDQYYDALNKQAPLSQYYSSASPLLVAAGAVPDLSINGLVVSTPAAYEALLKSQSQSQSQRPPRYEVGSWDAQPVNPDYRLGCPEDLLAKPERVSFAVQVSGTVRYGGGGSEEPEERAFSEAWLLVPHWEAWGRNAARGSRRWVVVSQNFRAL